MTAQATVQVRGRVKAAITAAILLLAFGTAHAASGQRPPPTGAPSEAEAEFTEFTSGELIQGFIAVAFGSDLRVGSRPKGIRKFAGPVRMFIRDEASVSRGDAYRRIVREFVAKIPRLATTFTEAEASAGIVVRLIDERNFVPAIENAFGKDVARRFVAKTDPQCVTSVKSAENGTILRADVFIIADKGDTVFLDCAYHETLHAFGLSNHADKNPWTTLNQNRIVGYLTVYDRSLLTMLYDPAILPGMTLNEVRRALPAVVARLPFTR